MTPTLLLACDLDRTTLPNGTEPFSQDSKIVFQDFISQSGVCLAYISGRSLKHALRGIEEYTIPLPNIYIGDTGTSMYIRNENNEYEEHVEWQTVFAGEWGNVRGEDIHVLLINISTIVPQEDEHQNTFKRSYYFNAENEESIVKEVKEKLSKLTILYEVISHVDHDTQKGYLDIIPKSANKECALLYLQKYLSLSINDVVYAGDGGNDMAPLTSGCKAIVVNNATETFKDKVKDVAKEKGTLQNIYFAHGDYKGFNGNYIAGIVEGLNYFGIMPTKMTQAKTA
jgi:HAD superfamily hydrolase (TIGR01484 family)